MLTHIKRGTVVLATRDSAIEATVGQAVADIGPRAPRLTKVSDMGDCVVAVRLLDPSLVLLDDGIQHGPGTGPLQEIRATRPSAPVVYIASQHSLDLEREVRRLGVLFYIARPECEHTLKSFLVGALQGLLRKTG